MEKFSLVDENMRSFEERSAVESLRAPVDPFTEKERTPSRVVKRLQESVKDFWLFDRHYFTPEIYSNKYSEPNDMMRAMVDASDLSTGRTHAEIFFGPRKHGKTVTGKKLLAWLLLTGRATIAGTYAETLPKSQNILADVAAIIETNERIRHDFSPEFIQNNTDQFQFRCLPSALKSDRKKLSCLFGNRFCMAFSEGRSVRGYTRMFGRPTFLLADDIETLESSFASDAVRLRVAKLAESFHSMDDGGVLLILGNDFDDRSALHQLRLQNEQGILAEQWHFTIYKAWDQAGPLWFKRYPAKSEDELKAMIGPADESDWQANYQQNPVPPEGDFFKREHYAEYTEIPQDVKGTLWTDPNLSKKGRGDTTAINALLYSPSTDCYYVPAVACKSFSDSNTLLDEVFRLKQLTKVHSIGFDGNVSQESTWTNNVRNYCRINKTTFPHIEYRRYNVDDLAKNLQAIYAKRRLLFAPGLGNTKEGKKFLDQFFAFTGKKSNKKDDAPDSLISNLEFITERGSARRVKQVVVAVLDHYHL